MTKPKPHRPGVKWSAARRRDAGLDFLDAETKAVLDRLGLKAGNVIAACDCRG
jgi:hypothetical protein